MEARVTTSIKLNPTVKKHTQAIFNELGLTMSDAINMFLKQVELHKGMPFDVRIPNEKTRRIMYEAEKGINVDDFNIDELR